MLLLAIDGSLHMCTHQIIHACQYMSTCGIMFCRAFDTFVTHLWLTCTIGNISYYYCINSLLVNVHHELYQFNKAIYMHCSSSYRIHSTFGSDFNLAVWWLWLWSLNLMHANTTYNLVFYEVSWSNVHATSSCSPN